MKSIPLGNSGERTATAGKVLIGLITQRSKVQILPPQPTDSIILILAFVMLETATNFRTDFVSNSF